MKKLSLKSLSTFQYLFFTLVLLLVLLGLYRYSYIPNRIDYFTDRNLRLLSNMSRQLSDVVESYKGQIDKNFTETNSPFYLEEMKPGKKQDSLALIKKRLKKIHELDYLDAEIVDGSDTLKKMREPDALNRIPRKTVEIDSNSFYTYASMIEYELKLRDKGYYLLMTYAGWREENAQKFSIYLEAQVPLHDLLAPFLKPDVFDNILVIENTLGKSKEVIYQAEQQTFFVTRIDSLSKNIKETWSSYDEEVTWGNKKYRLFAQPVRIALIDQYSDRLPDTKDWMLVGLVDAKKFNAEARAISRFYMSQMAFIFFIFLFSIPFIKLYFIGKREELRAKDLMQCTFSFFVLTGLISFWLLSLYSDRKDLNDLDGALKPLAQTMEKNLYSELKNIIDQSEMISADSQWKQSDNTKYLFPKVLSKSEGLGLFSDRAISELPYPFFRQFSWINEYGMQIRKISSRGVITPLVDVAERDYFKKIYNDQAWMLSGDTFYLEPIISITTGKNVAAVSTKVQGGSGGVVNMMEVDLISLAKPVFPKGFGFCVVNEKGRVLFHSSPEKNMQENFFIECNDAPRLWSSVGTRVENYLTVDYEGREHRIFTRPFKNIPDWTLITFADLWQVRSSQLNALSSAVLLFILLALWVPIFLVWIQGILILLSRFEWSDAYTWFWPSKERTEKYKLHSILLFGLAGLHFGAIFLLSPGANLLGVFIVPSLTVLFTFFYFKSQSPKNKGYESKVEEEAPKPQPSILKQLWVPGLLLLLTVLGASFPSLLPIYITYCFGGLFIGAFLNLNVVADAISTAKLPRYYAHYTLGSIALFLATSLIPAIALFKISYDAEKKVLVRSGQFSLVQGLQTRALTIDMQLDDRGLSDSLQLSLKEEREELDGAADIYSQFFFYTRLYDSLPEIGQIESKKMALSLPAKPDAINILPKKGAVTPAKSIFSIITNDGMPPFSYPWSDFLFAWFRPRMKFVDYQNWELYRDQTADSSISWKQWYTDSFNMHLLTKEQEKNEISIFSFSTPFLGPAIWKWLLVLFVLLSLLFVATRYYNHQVFGINLILPYAQKDKKRPIDSIHQNTLFIGYPNSGKSTAISKLKHSRIIDLTKLSGPEALADYIKTETNLAGIDFIVIDHFDLFWKEQNWNPQLLNLLEDLIGKSRKKVVLVTAVDPTLYFRISAPNGQNKKADTEEELITLHLDGFHRNRWNMLLSNFTKVYYKIPDANMVWVEEVKKEYGQNGEASSDHKQLLDTLISECQHTPLLQETGLEILERYEKLDQFFANEEALIDEILLRSEAFYQAIWSLCSVDEKITLIHLSRNQFVPYKDAPVVRRLMRKGLVSLKNYRLLNKSFAYFVRDAEPEHVIQYWKKDQEKGWESIRTPLITFIIAILAFTFVTQREIFNTSIAWITTIGALIPTILRIMSFIGPRTGAGEAAGDDG
jgi:hypothetical protein